MVIIEDEPDLVGLFGLWGDLMGVAVRIAGTVDDALRAVRTAGEHEPILLSWRLAEGSTSRVLATLEGDRRVTLLATGLTGERAAQSHGVRVSPKPVDPVGFASLAGLAA